MKREEKKIVKIIKKGFSLDEWKSFSNEAKNNDLILVEVAKKLERYDIESIKEIVEENKQVAKYLTKQKQLNIVNNDNFYLLSEDIQEEIVEKNNNKVKYASEEVQIKFATKNPLKLSFLSNEVQRKMIDNNNFYLEFASKEIQVEYAKKDINLLSRCCNMIQCWFIKIDPNNYPKCSAEVKKQIIALSNLSPERISIETLESYLSNHYDNLSLEELDKYKTKIEKTTRQDKSELLGYIDYLQVNIEKKKL